MENFPNKKILINNISSLQNNYYRECKPIGNITATITTIIIYPYQTRPGGNHQQRANIK